MATFLITGGLGYIGCRLTKMLLDRDHKVVCVDDLRYGQGRLLAAFQSYCRYTFVKADVRDVLSYARHTHGADAVIPLAALVGEPVCKLYQREATEVNVDAIARLLKVVGPSQRIIFPTTNSGYGQTDGTSEVDEDSPLNPVSHYGRTKVEAEKIVLVHPNTISFRLATVCGVSLRMRFDLLVNDLTHQLRRATPEKPVVLFEPDYWRNFVHIDDVCWAFMGFASSQRTGVYNLGDSSANCTKRELARTICRELGLPETVFTVGDGRDPDQRNYRVSNRKLERAGFSCSKSLSSAILEVDQYVQYLTPTDVAEARNVLPGEDAK